MSVLRIKDLFSRPGSPAYPFRDSSGQLCWLESITEQGGRIALRQQQADDSARIVTPEGMQIRSRVHEYGGKCFCVTAEHIFFNNYDDGLVYRQPLSEDAAPVAVVAPVLGSQGYADLCYSDALDAIVAVQELQSGSGGENLNQLVVFPGAEDVAAIPQVLAQGSDFYAAPRLSPGGDRIIWLQWQHPNMPWDEASLVGAALSRQQGEWRLDQVQPVAGGDQVSVCQPGFLESGEIVFAMDRQAAAGESPDSASNFWNLYLASKPGIQALTRDEAEYGEAHWVFGQQRWVQTGPSSLLAIATRDEQDSLHEIDLESGQVRQVGLPCARLSQLSMAGEEAICVAHYSDRPPEVIGVGADGRIEALKIEDPWLDRAEVALPERMAYPTRDGGQAYANFYPGRNMDDAETALVVLVHGGPTSRADTSLKPLVQYFAQNGFSVLDVNHRGSTGHGRRYRQALLGRWGEIDADDIADAIAHVCNHRPVDPTRIFIRGGSAGGYAVMRALTRFPELFRGGACYYGIGNLITLAEITHKFEARYTDRLIGEEFSIETANRPESRFHTRSPIFYIDRIRSPLILFQGLDDKVVPPEVSREIVRTLEANGIRHEYIEYEGEGHGFRQAETRIDSLEREIRFYREILGESGGIDA